MEVSEQIGNAIIVSAVNFKVLQMKINSIEK